MFSIKKSLKLEEERQKRFVGIGKIRREEMEEEEGGEEKEKERGTEGRRGRG